MNLYLANKEGELMLAVENVEQYNLSKPMARAELVDEIARAIELFARRNVPKENA